MGTERQRCQCCPYEESHDIHHIDFLTPLCSAALVSVRNTTRIQHVITLPGGPQSEVPPLRDDSANFGSLLLQFNREEDFKSGIGGCFEGFEVPPLHL